MPISLFTKHVCDWLMFATGPTDAATISSSDFQSNFIADHDAFSSAYTGAHAGKIAFTYNLVT